MSNLLDSAATEFKRRIESGEAQLPEGAEDGPYRLGAAIMVSRDSIHADIRNPDLPKWFPARVCLPPDEPGNWYRWYDPFVWYETEIDLSNGGDWSTANRGMCYVGKTFYRPTKPWPSYDIRDFWAYPLDVWRELFGGEA